MRGFWLDADGAAAGAEQEQASTKEDGTEEGKVFHCAKRRDFSYNSERWAQPVLSFAAALLRLRSAAAAGFKAFNKAVARFFRPSGACAVWPATGGSRPISANLSQGLRPFS